MTRVEKMLWKDEKAQVSTEYLLLLGGTVLVATAVGLYIKQIPSSTTSAIEKKSGDILNPN